jgi:hypothetical protein
VDGGSYQVKKAGVVVSKVISRATITKGFWNFRKLPERKRKRLHLMFPEKLIFEKKACQTIKPLEVINLVCRTGGNSNGTKKKLASENGSRPCQVIPIGQISNQILEELAVLAQLYKLLTIIPGNSQ